MQSELRRNLSLAQMIVIVMHSPIIRRIKSRERAFKLFLVNILTRIIDIYYVDVPEPLIGEHTPTSLAFFSRLNATAV